jgi:hypothetical protein
MLNSRPRLHDRTPNLRYVLAAWNLCVTSSLRRWMARGHMQDRVRPPEAKRLLTLT